MKRVLITGASGMLGANLANQWEGFFEIFATGRSDYKENAIKNYKICDFIHCDFADLVEWSNPDIIIHSGSMTGVDECEKNPKKARIINVDSVKKIYQSSPDSKHIFISTEAVFQDGIYKAKENEDRHPENIYGETKKQAEDFLIQNAKDYVIVRQTIVGKNRNKSKTSFVEWIVKSLKDKKQITLFTDSIFTPITIWQLGEAINWIIQNDRHGVFHLAGRNEISKYDFGKDICKILNLDINLISAGSIDNFYHVAKRSKDQTLDCSLFEKESGFLFQTHDNMIKELARHFSNDVS